MHVENLHFYLLSIAKVHRTEVTYIGSSVLLSIIQIVHSHLAILDKPVTLDLPSQQKLVQQLLVCPGQQLVEDVVTPLTGLLGDDTGLLQEVCERGREGRGEGGEGGGRGGEGRGGEGEVA